MGPPALLPIREEGVLLIFIALKVHRLGRVRTRNLGFSGKHTNNYTTSEFHVLVCFKQLVLENWLIVSSCPCESPLVTLEPCDEFS
jgi:hypothetical protein